MRRSLRELQDECGGFMAYIPLAFWPYHTDLQNYGHVTTGALDLRFFHFSRAQQEGLARGARLSLRHAPGRP